MKFTFIALFLISMTTSAQELNQLQVSAEPPLCFEDTCFVHLNFYGFENLPAELFAESANLGQCGGANTSQDPEGPSAAGFSRTVMIIKANGKAVERICNPQLMPTYRAKSMVPQRVLTFHRTEVPKRLVVKFKDRKLKKKYKYRVAVPQPEPVVSSTCTDGRLTPYIRDYSYVLKNRQYFEKNLYTYCFDIPAKKSTFFEVQTVNKGNTQCSDFKMKVISPSGRAYVSYGSQPGASPMTEAGQWKIQFYLNYGCDRYDLNIRY